MRKPSIEPKFPKLVTLEPGAFSWCSCRKSSTQPFCDGTHKGTRFTPVLFKIAEKREEWLCQCKQSKNAPFCDKTHKENGEALSLQE